MQSKEERISQNNVIIKTCYWTDLIYLSMRLIFMIIFFIGGYNELGFISLGSVIIYTLFSLLIKFKKYYLYVLGCGNEFLVYSILGTIFAGSAPGFYLNIVGLSIVSFFTVYFSIKKRPLHTAITWTVMSIIICLGLHIYCIFKEPITPLTVWVNSVLFAIHIVVVFGFIIGYLLIFTKYAMNLEEKIKKESRIDQLTKIANRYDLFNYLDTIEDKNDYALAMFDIDDFKTVNDTFGHSCGDFILKTIADIVKEHSEGYFLSRYGGEEFIIIAKINDDINSVYNHLDFLRELIKKNDFYFNGNIIKITISFGIEKYHDNITDEKWIVEADNKLYVSKRTGKNKITM